MQTIPDPPPPVTTPETAEATAEKRHPGFFHVMSAVTPVLLAARIEAAEATAPARWVGAASGPDYRAPGGDGEDGQ